MHTGFYICWHDILLYNIGVGHCYRTRFGRKRRVFHRPYYGRYQDQSGVGPRGKIHVQTVSGGYGQRTSAQTDDSHAQSRSARLE